MLRTIFSIALLFLLLVTACNEKKENQSKEIKSDDSIALLDGFKMETLYAPSEKNQGSWVSITQDNEGNLYTSDQHGNLYKVTLPNANNNLDSVQATKLSLKIGMAQGLLWHKKELFALVNASDNEDLKVKNGFYKIIDSNQDKTLDSVIPLRFFNGGAGEHGPHSIVLSPDKQAMFLVFGNHVDIPEDISSRVSKNWDEDNLLPVIKDPSGHANDVKAPGGWVVKTDFNGEKWELQAVGLRNTYDIGFNDDGELFGFDSDMEYDLGMPWYRPIRLCHLTAASDFGWRTGTGKFAPSYPDNLPAIANLGQGSPTGLLFGSGLNWPEKYKKSVFLFDWSYGTMYYASLTPDGSSYKATVNEFLSGVPLPLTDGIVGKDGAMYFLTGGRRLGSGLHKITYTGEIKKEAAIDKNTPETVALRKLRHRLESYQTTVATEHIPFLIENLNHADRFIRFAARTALEQQDYSLWKNAYSSLKTTQQIIEYAIAVAHQGTDKDRAQLLTNLVAIKKVAPNNKIAFLRSLQLLIARSEGELSTSLQQKLKSYLLPSYLKGTDLENKEVLKLLSYLQVDAVIEKTLLSMEKDTLVSQETKDLYLSGDISQRSDQYGKDVSNMLANMPNQQHISYAKSLSILDNGWTRETRTRYFKWFNGALKKSGGKMYTKFIKAILAEALKLVPEDDQAYFESIANENTGESVNYMDGVSQPKGPGKNWSANELVSAYENRKGVPNFKNGQDMFRASLCINCHNVNGLGGNSGPELSKVGTRFSIKDMADAIITPSATISDRYRYYTYEIEDGSTISGRVIKEEDGKLELTTNAFATNITTTINKKDIVKKYSSNISPMPSSLINRLNEKELIDLMTYLVVGGKEDPNVY